MRRYWVLALAVLTLLGGLAPPAFAQAPAPKVTIQGVFNLVTAWSSNYQDIDATRTESEWYSRQRGRLDFIGEMGKAKMVWGIELDFVNGNTTTVHAGTTAGFDLDTDIAGAVETKWLYLQFPLTGPGSILPFIPLATTATGGGQPFVGHDYKLGILATGDFGGFNFVTTITPTVKNTLTFVQIEEKNFRGEQAGPAAAANAANRESWAFIDSLEFAVSNELTVKPTFSVAIFSGPNAGTVGLGTPSKGGLALAAINNQGRATIGGDLRWRSGPWSLEPTFHYQWGAMRPPAATVTATGKDEVDISAWILDIIGGWRSGPLNLEGRFVYTSGNDADECVAPTGVVGAGCVGGSDINYYTPINPGFVYFAGWSETWTSALDYAQTFLAGGTGAFRRGQSIGYDKYGLITFAARATYAVTPAFSLVGIVSPAWTATKVDTNGPFAAATGITPLPDIAKGETTPKGDHSYLGTEIVAGFTWNFAPGLKYDMRYSHLFAGDALNQCQVAALPSCALGTPDRGAKGVDRLTARVDYSF